jgi:hypothetical protein
LTFVQAEEPVEANRITWTGDERRSGFSSSSGIEADVGWEVHGGVQRRTGRHGQHGLAVNVVALAFVGGCCR